MNQNKNIEVDRILDQPEAIRAVMRKDVFIKGKQDSVNDVPTFISNIIVYSQFWINISNEDTNDIPCIIQMLTEIVLYLIF